MLFFYFNLGFIVLKVFYVYECFNLISFSVLLGKCCHLAFRLCLLIVKVSHMIHTNQMEFYELIIDVSSSYFLEINLGISSKIYLGMMKIDFIGIIFFTFRLALTQNLFDYFIKIFHLLLTLLHSVCFIKFNLFTIRVKSHYKLIRIMSFEFYWDFINGFYQQLSVSMKCMFFYYLIYFYFDYSFSWHFLMN